MAGVGGCCERKREGEGVRGRPGGKKDKGDRKGRKMEKKRETNNEA